MKKNITVKKIKEGEVSYIIKPSSLKKSILIFNTLCNSISMRSKAKDIKVNYSDDKLMFNIIFNNLNNLTIEFNEQIIITVKSDVYGINDVDNIIKDK